MRKYVKKNITDGEIKQFLGVKDTVCPKQKGGGFEFYIDEKHQNLIYDLISKEKATLIVYLLACYNILCYKYTGLRDHIQAIITAVRDHSDIDNIVALISSNIYLRNEINEGYFYKEFLEIVNENFKEAQKNKIYPFQRLLNYLDMPMNLASIQFNYREPVDRKILPGDLIPKHIKQDFGPWFDLYSSIHEYHDGIQVFLHYDARLFMPKVIEKLWVDYLGIINNVAENPDFKIRDF